MRADAISNRRCSKNIGIIWRTAFVTALAAAAWKIYENGGW
jgi:hypothetical protein